MSCKALNLLFVIIASRHCQAGIEQNFLPGTNAVKTDSTGAIFVAGGNTGFPTTPGSYQPQFQPPPPNGFTGTPPYTAPFVGKFSATGDIIWGTYITGDQPGLDSIAQMVLDSHGNIWVAGVTTNRRFPLTSNAYSKSVGPGFLAELSADGTQLLYSTFIDFEVNGLLIDQNDDLYLVGSRVVKFRPSINTILYDTSSTSLPAFPDRSFSVVDRNGAVFIAGSSASFEAITPGTYSHPSTGADVIVVGIDPAGMNLLFATRIGSSGDDVVSSMTRDDQGNIYVAGSPGASDFPVSPDAAQPTWKSGFLFKLSADGSSLLYSSFLGQNQNGGFVPQKLKISVDGTLHMLATSTQTDPPLTPDSFLPCYHRPPDQGANNHWTYIRLSSDLHSIEYATAVPVSPLEPYPDLGPFFFDTSGKLFMATSNSNEPFFEILDASRAPHEGIVCIAESVTQTNVYPNRGLMVSVLGPGIGPDRPATLALDPDGRVATQLADTQVLFDGIPAPILSAAAARIDVVAPFAVHGDLASGTTTVSVLRFGELVGTFTVLQGDNQFRLFSVDGSGYGAVGWNQDGTPNSADHPAQAGDILSFYGTGAGDMTPMPVDGTIPRAPQATVRDGLSFYSVPVCKSTYFGDAPGMVEGIVQLNCEILPNIYLTPNFDYVGLWFFNNSVKYRVYINQ
jgi:uncharacterized protein (TIGR03437 family)